MNVSRLAVTALLFSLFSQSSIAQLKHYLKPKADHVGIFFDVGQNFGSSVASKDRTSVGVAPVLRLGTFYNKHLSASNYVGAALSFNLNSYAFKYKKTFETSSDTTFPKGAAAENRALFLPVIEPALYYGFYLPLSENNHLDIRIGLSAPVTLRRIDSVFVNDSVAVTLKPSERVVYGTSEHLQVNTQRNFITLNGTIYIGFKKIGFNDLSDRLSLGVVASFVIWNKYAPFIDLKYHNYTYNYVMYQNQHKLVNNMIGLRVSYEFF